MPTYEYLCDECHEVSTDLRKVVDRSEPMACSVCDGTARFIVSTPQIMLEGISGDFPGAADRWAKMRKQRVAVERKAEQD